MIGCPDCPIASALRYRIEVLEERCERAEAAAERNIVQPPYEWCLTPQEAVAASCLARGDVSTDGVLAALEHAQPTSEGRGRGHARVIMCRLRAKLADFGWVLCEGNNHACIYRILPSQHALFVAAMRGTGEPAHPSMTKKGGRAA